MAKTTSSKSLNNTFTSTEEKYVRLAAKQSLRIIFSGTGNSSTDKFRKLALRVNKLREHLFQGKQKQTMNVHQMEAMNGIFYQVADKMNLCDSCMEYLPIHISKAQSIMSYIEEIVESRDMINQEPGFETAKRLERGATIMDRWITLDLVSYCWNNGSPRCNHSLGVLIGMAHEFGRQEGLIIEHFGPDAAQEMFEAVSPEGIEFVNPPIRNLPKSVIIYRGGQGKELSDVASGMCWTRDFKIALKWANNGSGQLRPFVAVAQVDHDQILATFEHESEVVIKHDIELDFYQAALEKAKINA